MNEPIVIIGQLSICVVLIGLVTVWLNHLLANTRDRQKTRRDAGKTVTDAFRPELDALIQTDEDVRLILTTDAYRRHESAVRNFMPFLSWIDRFMLREAWRALAHHPQDKKHRILFYGQWADCGSLTKRRAVRPVVVKRVQRIISLAQK